MKLGLLRKTFGILAVFGAFSFAAPAFGQSQQPDSPATNTKNSAEVSEQVAEEGGTSGAKIPTVLEERAPIIPTSAFAGRSIFNNPKLSPDGKLIAARAVLNGVDNIIIIDADTRKPITKFVIGNEADVDWHNWAGNGRILLGLSAPGKFFGEDVRYTRLYMVDLSTKKVESIGRREPVVEGDNVIHIAEDGSHVLLSIQKTIQEYPSVIRFNLDEDREVRTVQRPKKWVWNWSADNAGVIRTGTGWHNDRMIAYYRGSESNELKRVDLFKREEGERKFWDVAALQYGSDQGYVFNEGDSGRVGIYRYDFATREVLEKIYENPDWDIDSFHHRDGVPLGADYTDDWEKTVWFDAELNKYQTSLEKALNQEQVQIISRSRDSSRLVVWAGGGADPGALYIFNPIEKRLDQLVEMRANVDFKQLAEPKPITYKARDGLEIRAYLTLPRGREAKDLPLIIMPHGGPYGVRDTLNYDDWAQMLANRGYAVLQPNFRGSDGYGESFVKLGTGEIGRKMQDDLDDAMDWAVKQGIAAEDRVCMVGGSYGGYASLWAVIRNPERYRCAASWAGVTDFKSQLRYDKDYFTRAGNRRWKNRVRGEKDFDLDTISPAQNAAGLNRPVLLAHGTKDNVVPFSQFRKMRNASRNAPTPPQLLEIKGEGHSFDRQENEKQWYDTLLAFLQEHNPPE